MFLTNVDLKNVSEGMVRVVEVLDNRPKSEKQAILLAVFSCLFKSKLEAFYNLSELIQIANNMEVEAKRTKVPEYGGAKRFIIGEL